MGLPPRLENQRVYFWMSRGILHATFTRTALYTATVYRAGTEYSCHWYSTYAVRYVYSIVYRQVYYPTDYTIQLYNTLLIWLFGGKTFIANTFTSITLRRTRAHRHNSDSTNPHARSGPTIPTNYAIRDAFFPVPAEPYHHTTATRTHHRSRTSASLSVR